MDRKIILAIGAIAVIVSLTMPVYIEKQTLIDTIQTEGSYWGSRGGPSVKPVYATTTEIDYYKTGARTFSIALGTLVLFT